jgi:hypothetical protein
LRPQFNRKGSEYFFKQAAFGLNLIRADPYTGIAKSLGLCLEHHGSKKPVPR